MTILILDDEERVRSFLAMILRRSKYVVLEAGTIDEADAACQEQRVDVVLADALLAHERSGVEFGSRIVRNIPRIRIVFMSGYAPDELPTADMLRIQSMPSGSYSFLRKPFSMEALLHALADIADGETNFRTA